MEAWKRKKYRFGMDLQLFADGDNGGGGTEGGEGGAGGSEGGAGSAGGGAEGGSEGGSEGGDKGSKTFTQEDVNKMLSKRIAEERAKLEKETNDKILAAKTEAEKLAKMNADQKAEYERQKRETELQKRESEITRRELRSTALETLAERGMPKILAEILNYTDADSTSKSIDAVEKAFRTAVQAGIDERLRQDPPKAGSGGNTGAVPDAAEIKKIFGG